jgi:hypothetical protein
MFIDLHSDWKTLAWIHLKVPTEGSKMENTYISLRSGPKTPNASYMHAQVGDLINSNATLVEFLSSGLI